jgi:multidrug transporter EmrE-like cation transporter
MTWVYLVVAIVGEVIGTTALKASNGFTVLAWSLVAVAGYAVAFYFLSVVLKTIPVGVAYAVWSGLGVAFVTVIGVVLFGQRLDGWAWIGIGLIVAGVMVLNLLSDTSGH